MILQNRWMTGNPRCHLYVLPTSFPFSSGSFFCPFSFKPNASASISCISSRHKPERKHLCTGKLLHNNQQLLKRSNYEGRNMRTKWFSVCLIFWDARSKQENILLNVFLYIFFLNFCKCNVLLNFFFNKEKQGFLCSLEKEFSKADKKALTLNRPVFSRFCTIFLIIKWHCAHNIPFPWLLICMNQMLVPS